tara:strand:- start:622 stop:2241 length:1620 start_codon:yes stop_codon:yes gene_type:complete
MASEILIRQAEKMYKSMADTTDYAKLATQPAVAAMKAKLAEQKKLTDEMVASSPSGIAIDEIPPTLRPMIADWTTEMKNKYVEFGKVTASGIPSTDPKYLEARDGMQRIQDAFEKLKEDLGKTSENIQGSYDTQDIRSKYSKLWQQTDHLRWANKSIYESILKNGIGEDGGLSYTSEEIDNRDYLDDGITVNPNRGKKKIKFVTDFGVFTTNAESSGDVDVLLENMKILGRKGEKFDEYTASSMVTTLINKLGPKGIGDLMYSSPMYIKDFIEKNQEELARLYGVTGETDEEQYDDIYEALKDQDLTEEFTSHVLGTLEEPGMMRSAHASAFREYNDNNVTKTDYGREFAGIWRNDQLVREKTTAVNNQQTFWDFEGTRWNPIGGDMFEDEEGNKRNKFDIAVDNDFPMQLMTGKSPGYTPAEKKSVESTIDDQTTILGTNMGHSTFQMEQEEGAANMNQQLADYKDFVTFQSVGSLAHDEVAVTAGPSHPTPGEVLFTMEFDYGSEKKQKKEMKRFNSWLKTQDWYMESIETDFDPNE